MAARSLIDAPSENWDDDFVFQKAKDLSNIQKPDSDLSQWSTKPTCQDWSADATNSTSPLSHLDMELPTTRLQVWAEPGPSTPPKPTVTLPTENWDDDFEDKTDSPARQPHSRPHHKSPKFPDIPEPENWDDDLESNRFISPKKCQSWDSSDEEDPTDFVDQEEDKTVTARSRRVALINSSPPPPLPAFPLQSVPVGAAFPRSPTSSIFSLPSPRNSATYSSLAHLPLRSGSASALAVLPPNSPPQRPRRRLRKKSRPPDNNVFELLDRRQHSAPLPSPQSSSPNLEPIDLPPSDSSNPSRTSILSRIGSVTKWGVRKRRTSPSTADPVESIDGKDATPRPAAASQALSPTRTPSWFFRSSDTSDSIPGSPLGSATLELKHERSFRHLRAYPTVDSPTKQGRTRAAILGECSHDSGSTSTLEGSQPSSPRRPRRPTSMQVPTTTPPHFPRHASYGAPSMSRSPSHTSIGDINRKGENKGKEIDGHRGFMSGIRRISLVSPRKRHKRTKSTQTVDEPPLPSIPQILPLTISLSPTHSSHLLPPIELQPPSPPRAEQDPDEPRKSITSERSLASTSDSLAAGAESLLLQPAMDIKSSSLQSPPSIIARPLPTKNPGSPQAASLGRSTQPPPAGTVTGIVPRRNSLGDLKIPTRISQAQVGLKRDLGMVREFAAEVEKLRELQTTYQSLAAEAQTVLERTRTRDPPRATSPTFFNLPRTRSRARSNASPNPSLELADPHRQFSALFSYLEHKYKISWECAELLIELGGGPPAPTSQSHTYSPASAQQLIHPLESISCRKSRERAITLAGDESVPPLSMSFSGPSVAGPPGDWRASTGRNDLSQRQLWLLHDMLNRSDSSPTMLADLEIPEEGSINKTWREATSSAITLPSDGSLRNSSSPAKKRRYSRLGMSGLRDLLRSLTRGNQHPPTHFRPTSSASTSASSSYDDQSMHASQETNGIGLEGTPICPSSPFSATPALSHKSPRRPSIASIFRFAHRGKTSPPGGTESKHCDHSHRVLHSYGSGSDLSNRNGIVDDEEDWDHLDSAEDLDAAAHALGLKDLNGTATLRGRRTKQQQHPYHQPEREQKASSMKKSTSASASQSSLSLWAETPSTGSRSQVSLPSTAAPVQPTSLPHPPLPATAPQAAVYMRPTRLSNVEEMTEAQLDNNHNHRTESESHVGSPTGRAEGKGKSKSPRRTSLRRRGLTGSVRSAPPPTPLLRDGDRRSLALSLTPETIRPLLENAREVHAKCIDCVDELRTLLAVPPS